MLKHDEPTTPTPMIGTMLRAVTTGHDGGRGRPRLVEIAPPTPGPDDVLVEVHAAGVNRLDLLHVSGDAQLPAGEPPILGVELAGVVRGTGTAVRRWAEGDKVCGLVTGGAYAEVACVREGDLIPLPPGLSFEEGASLVEAMATAWHALFEVARAQPSEFVLVHGGASSVGLALAQLAARAGVQVIASCSTQDKATSCIAAGAHVAVVHTEESLTAAVDRVTRGQGVDVIIDNLGGQAMAENLQMLAMGGRLVSVGSELGHDAVLPLQQFRRCHWTMSGFSLSTLAPHRRRQLLEDLVGACGADFAASSLRPLIHEVFELGEVEAAHAAHADRRRVGKVVLLTKSGCAHAGGTT